MYLKEIELFGFKSFPEKTSFLFEPGITAIVGPNGCGKTNIVDAVRWVLGEQSASALRGSRMEDVIFDGTDGRKPLSMAEVSLILDNQDGSLALDYSEVMVTRRVFRSGESEYFINKAPCRLKDINELFMDTGVGTKSYSLLEQGKVDLILSSKPEDRRFLFEEAAGITKYKSRKREALRKLESTEQNLLRVDDIVTEVKRQIGSLRRQVGKAKRYQKLSEQLKEFEITLALDEFRRLEEKRGKSGEELRKMREGAEALSSDVGESESNLVEMRASLIKTEAEANQVLGDIRDIREKIIQSENNVVLYKDRIEALNKREKDAGEQIEILRNKHTSVLEELSNLEREKVEIERARNDGKNSLEEGERRLEELAVEMKEKQKELTGIKEEIVEVASLEAKSRSELASLEAVDKSYDARERRLSDEKLQSSDEKTGCEKEFAGVSVRWEEGKNEIGAKEISLKQVESRVSELQTALGNLREAIYSKRDELNSLKSALKLMEEMERNYEGYACGVRTVMAARDSLAGICGVVADLLNVPGNLQAAVEAALGEKVQYVVIEETQHAERAIFYLKEREGGRATFLPLDLASKIREERPLDGIISNPGVIGVAASEVKFDPRYMNAFNLLLGGIVIVDNLETARALLPKLPAGCKFATLDGEVIDASGLLSGGSAPSKGTGLIGRNERVREMEESIRELTLSLEGLESDEKKVSDELSKSVDEAEGLKSELHQEEEQFGGLENMRSQLQNDLERLSKDISLVDDEMIAVRKDRDRVRVEIQGLTDKFNAILGDKENCDQRMLVAQQYIEDRVKEKEEVSSRLTETRISLASFDEREESLKTAFSLRQKTCSEYEEEMNKRRAEIETAEGQVKEFEAEIVSIQSDLTELAAQKEQFEEKRQEIEEQRKGGMSRIQEMENSLREKREALRKKEDEAHQVDVQQTQVGMEISSLTDKIFSRYRMDLRTLAAEREVEEIDVQMLSEEAVRLQTKLEAMGPVNLVAIEEHKELEERYNFLCEQRDDLSSAKESLHKAIAHINQTTRSMFLETFHKINEHFGETFRNLFDGGRAELILVDERNVLESGIEIIARPPGKKLQSVSLLSGGEKAMTAIALLFAIMRVKPSPFCVLDEIDAPLDDSNIGRFARLVRESSDGSQFIIVTHNKATIATSDVVHGITMEERGISKQVSVKFSEKEDRISATSKSERVTKQEPALQ